MQIFNAVIGTAGHIDHGKSSLVLALTGINPDRLKEEQDRGITIDLGFAPLDLGKGMRVGIIDVPGHERFVKNMVAGATGIDFVIMVIAADDGVMAQTRERLQIVQLLGVRDGLTVVTKKDLVEPAYLDLVKDDVRALEAGTVLDGKPIHTVSSKTGEGIAELKALLEKTLKTLARRSNEGPFRLPIQRVFAKEGFGTVVTGVPLSGRVAIGDTLDVLPPGYHGRVKGLHAYNQAITSGQAGHSTAVNLHGPGIDKQQVERGMVAVTPGIFEPTTYLSAQFTLLPGAPWPLKHRAAVRFHAGTAEIQAKLLLLEGDTIRPGGSAFVQVLLETPTVAAPGDRFILRCQSPMITLGGGRVLDVVSQKRKRLAPQSFDDLTRRLACVDDPEKFCAHLLTSAAAPKSVRGLSAETGLLPERVRALVAKAVQRGEAVVLRPDADFISAQIFREISARLEQAVRQYAAEHPALGAIERPELKRVLEKESGPAIAAYFDDILNAMKQRGSVLLESNSVSLPGRERKLEGETAVQAQQVERAFLDGALTPPSRAELETQLKIPQKALRELWKYLHDTGKLVDASPDVTFHRTHVDQAKLKLKELFAAAPRRTTSEIRQHLGMNRKYAVPLVELLDKEKFTVRNGDLRQLL